MPYKNDLLSLVEVLNPSEKGHLKKHAFHGLKDAEQLVKLFDLVSKFIKNNKAEETLDAFILNEKIFANLTKTKLYHLKSRLHETILSGLIDYDQNKSIVHESLALLLKGYSLTERKLTAQSLKYFNKAFKLSQQTQFISLSLLLFRLIIYQEVVLYGYKSGEFEKDKRLLEYENLLLNLSARVNCSVIDIRLSSFANNIGFPRTEVEHHQIDEIVSLLEEPKGNDPKVKVSYLTALNMYNWLKNDIPNILKNGQQIIDTYEAFPHTIEHDPLNYQRSLYNYLQQVILHGNPKLFDAYFPKFGLLRVDSKKTEVELNIHKNILLVFSNHHFGKHEANLKLGQELEPFVKKELQLYMKNKVHMFTYFISYSSLLMQDYDMCMHWIDLLESQKLDLRQETKVFCNMVRLVVHYELGNTRFLPSVVRQSKYVFKHKFESTESEKIFINGLNRTTGIPNLKDHKAVFSDMYEKIKYQIESDKKEFWMGGIFDILSWLKSKIENRSFIEVFEEKRAQSLEERKV